jgi:hypothetical protein
MFLDFLAERETLQDEGFTAETAGTAAVGFVRWYIHDRAGSDNTEVRKRCPPI